MQPTWLILSRLIALIVLLNLSSANAQSGFSSSQLMKMEFLKQIPPSFERDTALVIAYNLLAEKHIANDLSQAKFYIDSALTITERIKWQKGIARTYISLAHYYETTGHWDETNALLQQSIQISKRLGDEQGELAGLFRYGLLYWDLAGNYDKSLSIFNKCLRMATVQKDSSSMARVFYQMGIVYGLKKDYKKALFYFDQLKIFIEKHLTGAYKRTQLQIWTYNVAQIYLLTNRTQEAEAMLA